MPVIKKILKKILLPAKKIFFDRLISNYFSSNFNKRVLIAYITKPFLSQDRYLHSSFAESKVIAKVFNDLGYIVDIVNYDYGGRVDYEQYDIVFGFGPIFTKSLSQPTKPNIIRINYGTGTHPQISNQRCLKRLESVRDKKGQYLLESVRLVEEDYLPQTTLANAIVVIGNDYTADSYRRFFKGPIYQLPVSYYSFYDSKSIIANKDFTTAKQHFLFFTAGGMIHRGLDLLLEFFSQRDDLQLHICCPMDFEPKFKKAYAAELRRLNIHYYGFINIKSAIFQELINKCAFTILLSCSEGQSGSVANVMGNGGLIPLLTKEVGYDINKLGLVINDFSVAAIAPAVQTAINKNNEELAAMSRLAAESAKTQHSIDSFAASFQSAIQEVIKNNAVKPL